MPLSTIKAALGYAVYNALSSSVAVSGAAAAMSLLDMTAGVGPRWIAVIFALLGAAWRWWRFRLSLHAASTGAGLSGLMAYILGDTALPGVSALLPGLHAESLPMLNGLIVGLFGLVIITGVQDFLAAYAKRKAEGAR